MPVSLRVVLVTRIQRRRNATCDGDILWGVQRRRNWFRGRWRGHRCNNRCDGTIIWRIFIVLFLACLHWFLRILVVFVVSGLRRVALFCFLILILVFVFLVVLTQRRID